MRCFAAAAHRLRRSGPDGTPIGFYIWRITSTETDLGSATNPLHPSLRRLPVLKRGNRLVSVVALADIGRSGERRRKKP